MNWVNVLTSLLFLLLLTALVSWLVLYVRFCSSLEKRWAAEILHLLHNAKRRLDSENRQLRELKKERDAQAHSLREEAFAALLCDSSVDELEAYPGIGPGTVSKLRAAGFVNLATLHRARIRVHGLGAKRLSDIDYAVRHLLGKARSSFDAENCGQAQKLADQLETLSTGCDGLEAKARTRAQAAVDFIDHLGELVEYARAVTFWRWVRPISKDALVPSDLMETSLPDLEAALQAAEQRSAQAESTKRSPKPLTAILVATASPPPVRPVVPPAKPAGPTKDECLNLLEIPAATPLSADLVRRQWNLLSERLAPEKVSSMGADFVKLAQEKLAAVRRSAEAILEAMGEKLETNPSPPPAQDLRHNPDLDDVFGGM